MRLGTVDKWLAIDIVKQPPPPHYDSYYEKDLNDPHLVFRGSVIDDGEAVMLVKDIGLKTFYGKLAQELSEKGKLHQSCGFC